MKQHEFFERQMTALLQAEFSLADILCGLHNACVHGTVMTEAGANVTDQNLEKLFQGFDLALAAAREMEE